jgi:threonine synthase
VGQNTRRDAIDYVCGCRPNRGSDLGTLDVLYDYAAIARAVSARRMARRSGSFHRALLAAVADSQPRQLPPLPVGGTPLLAAPRLRARPG